jgi:hypothetical protein
MMKHVPDSMTFVTDDFKVVKRDVANIVIHPVGHSCPAIRKDWMAVEITSVTGEKWYRGTQKAFIDSHLKVAMEVHPNDEILAKWPDAN